MFFKARYSCLVLTAILLAGCCLAGCRTIAVDPQKARAFSDLFMDDVIHDRRAAFYSKMEPEFHEITSLEKFTASMDDLYQQFGKPIQFEALGYGFGARALTKNGQTKPYYDVIYSLTTTKGAQQFRVRVVPNGNDLAVTMFTFKLPDDVQY